MILIHTWWLYCWGPKINRLINRLIALSMFQQAAGLAASDELSCLSYSGNDREMLAQDWISTAFLLLSSHKQAENSAVAQKLDGTGILRGCCLQLTPVFLIVCQFLLSIWQDSILCKLLKLLHNDPQTGIVLNAVSALLLFSYAAPDPITWG